MMNPKKSFFSTTGRQRRLLLLVAVTLSALGILLASFVDEQRHRLTHANDDLLTISRQAAQDAGSRVEGARQLLNAITSGPSLKGPGLNALCIEFLANIRGSHHYYSNAGFLDTDGRLLCDAMNAAPATYLGDRTYFSQALATRSFAIGEYQVGRITGQASLNLGMPVYDNAGSLKGVAFVALELARLTPSVTASPDFPVSVSIVDRQGIIVGNDRGQTGRIGKPYPDDAVTTARQTVPTSTITARDREGALKMYAVTAVSDDHRPGLFAVASIARDAVTAPIQRKLVRDLGLLLLLSAVGILAAYWMDKWTVVTPARQLRKKINQLAGVTANDEMPIHGDEMEALSLTSEKVAGILKQRDAERDHHQAILQKTQDRLLTAQRLARIGNWQFSLPTLEVWWSAPTYEVFGVSPASFTVTAESLVACIFPEDHARCEKAHHRFLAGRQEINIEYRIVTGDGRIRWVHELGELERDAEGQIVGASGTIQDITERVRNERLLMVEARLLKALSMGLSLQIVLEEVLLGIESLLPSSRASIHLISEDDGQLQKGFAPNLPQVYLDAVRGQPIGPAQGSCGTAAWRGETVLVRDIDTDPLWTNFRELAREHGLRACWSTPVKASTGEMLATFAVYHKAPHTPSPEDQLLVQRAANIITIAIEADQKDAALRASEQRFRNTFVGAATGIAIMTLQGKFVEANPSYCNMLGYTQLELNMLDLEALTPAGEREKSAAELRELIDGQRETLTAERQYIGKNGRTVWARVSLSKLRDAAGKLTGIVAMTEDLTLKHEAEETLHKTQALLGMASRLSRLGAWQLDLPGYELTWSDEIRAIYELPADAQPSVEASIGFYAPEYRELVQKLVTDCMTHGVPFDAEMQLITARGRRIWVRAVGEAIRDEAGNITRLQGAFQDIDVQKQAESRESALAQRLTTTLESISDAFFLLDQQWNFVFLNGQTESLLKRSRAELLGQNIWEAFPEAVGSRFEHEYRGAIANNRTSRFEAFFEPLNSWFDVSAYPTEGGLAVYFQDITTKRSAAEQLRLLEVSVSHLNDIVMITEAEPISAPGPRILFVNEAFERYTGYSREEVMGKSPRILQGPKTQRAELDRIRAALEKPQPVRAEVINYTKAGKEYWLELDIVPVADADGRVTHFVSIERDISERKRVEGEILALNTSLEARVQERTRELNAANLELEAFSYSVSHDLRSPLNTIDGFSQMLFKTNQQHLDDKGRHYLSRIRAGAHQMGALIDGLLSLAKISRDPLRVQDVDLSALSHQVVQECREREPERDVLIIIEENLQVMGDPTLLLVAMQNLIGNAWKYTSRQARASVEVACETVPGGESVYVVRDNGAGFDVAYADKLFGAFQRLHSPSEFSGTGIGLANVKRVIERHGGRVWAEGRLNEGASFYFTLRGSTVPDGEGMSGSRQGV